MFMEQMHTVVHLVSQLRSQDVERGTTCHASSQSHYSVERGPYDCRDRLVEEVEGFLSWHQDLNAQ